MEIIWSSNKIYQLIIVVLRDSFRLSFIFFTRLVNKSLCKTGNVKLVYTTCKVMAYRFTQIEHFVPTKSAKLNVLQDQLTPI